MITTLKVYQEQAVTQILEAAQRLLASGIGRGKTVVFRSPTGSGKTVMAAEYIQRVIAAHPDEEFCFLWCTIGKGDLHIQSKTSLDRIFQGFPRCVLAEDEFNGFRPEIARNTVVFVNWEKIRSKDKQSGEWTNVLMRDGERINLREVLSNTGRKRKIIAIVDESHYGTETERALELVNIINPEIILAISATPTWQPSAEDVLENRHALVRVSPSRVMAEGMIKKELIINEGLGSVASDERTSQDMVLEAAHQKRLQLRRLFAAEESRVNPLVLVQLPNAADGEAKLSVVREFLGKKGITEENGRLAVWLSNYKTDNLEALAQTDSPVEFLVFKQAIDTGWDCPRAHILVKFRDTKSEVFEIQTVGRILRTPERRHYSPAELNTGYIYSNVESVIVKEEQYNPNIIKHLRSLREANYAPLGIISFYRSPLRLGRVDRDFSSIFNEVVAKRLPGLDASQPQTNAKVLEAASLILNITSYDQTIAVDARLSTDQLETKEDYVVASSGQVSARASAQDIQSRFESILKSTAAGFQGREPVDALKRAIYQWFRTYLGSKGWDSELLRIQTAILVNEDMFRSLLGDALVAYKERKQADLRRESKEYEDRFDPPVEMYYNDYEAELVPHAKHLHQPCYLRRDRSEPERRFEAFLEKNGDRIVWWWKNGEGDRRFFGIRYQYNGEVHTLYPDYIVQLSDGRICLFEVKDADDRDRYTITKAKAEALYHYLETARAAGQRVIGGVVIERTGAWRLNSQPECTWDRLEEWDVLSL